MTDENNKLAQHYKAIILVIASDDEYNDQYIMKKIRPEWRPLMPFFKQVYETYMHERDDMKIFFVYGNSKKAESKGDADLVYEDVKENDHPGIIMKTFKALEYIHHNFSYDFIVRTNLSTFWNLHLLSDRLDKLPKNGCLTGHHIRALNEEKELYIAGFDMVMSRDIIEKILPYKTAVINHEVQSWLEDLTLCVGFKKYANVEIANQEFRNNAIFINMDPFSEEALKDTLEIAKKGKVDHFRVKCSKNRNNDKIVMRRLLKEFYGKTLE